jgi:hypothetical protein
MQLPTATEIDPYNDPLDGQTAVRHFLGKTVDDAAAMITKGPLLYLEDFTYMGPRAFCFYLPATLSYLQSDKATGDSDFCSGVIEIILRRLNHRKDVSSIEPSAYTIRSICQYLDSNWDKFDVNEDIYKNAKSNLVKVEELAQQI